MSDEVGSSSPKVDALFSGDLPAPPGEAKRVVRIVMALLAAAIPMNLLGVPCWTGVPGAALTLWAWLRIDGESAAIDAGAYSAEDARRLRQLRTVAAWNLGLCVLSLLLQAWLLTTSFYEEAISRAVGILQSL